MRKKALVWSELLRNGEFQPHVSEKRSFLVKRYYDTIEIGIRPLIRLGIRPNFISFASLLVALISAVFYSQGAFFAGGSFLLVTGFLDTLDGTIARLTGKTTKFGALLDSTLDRYAEFFLFFGLLIYFHDVWVFYIVLLALMGSVMVSYIKAKGQSLGTTRSIGLMQRPERLILMILGSFLNAPFRFNHQYQDGVFVAVLVLLAVGTNITALRRLYEGKKELN